MTLQDLPAVDATLNFTSAVLLGAGGYFIHKRNVRAHKRCMLAAVVVSSVFLTCYLVYHYNVGSVRFTKQGWLRDVYFPLLISHTLLAVTILPLVLRTVYLSLSNRFSEHKRIARWTFPAWMYVSVTGVIVYLMLYRL